MGARSCGPLLSRAPRFFLRVPCPAFLCDIFFAFPCTPAFLFCVPSVCVGVGEQLITRALFVYGRIRQAGSTRHRATTLPPPRSCVRGVRVYWREASLGSNSCLVHNRPLPPLLSVHVITVSSLHRNANIAVLFFRVPRSRIPV